MCLLMGRGVPVTDNIRQKFGYRFGYQISDPIRIFVRIRFRYPNDSDIRIMSDNIGYRILFQINSDLVVLETFWGKVCREGCRGRV